MTETVKKTTSMRLPEVKLRAFNSIIAFKGEQFSAVIEQLVDQYIAENREFLAREIASLFPEGEEGGPAAEGEVPEEEKNAENGE